MTMYAFEVVGVFGAGSGGGSPLAVVYEAEGLGPEEMAWVAARLRVDETVFVLPPTAPGATHRVRVFTRAGESPYGGHSAVGTAVALVRSGRLPAGRVVQQCGEKLTELRADRERAVLAASGPHPVRPLDAAPLLAAAGLAPGDLGEGPVLAAGFGPLFHLLPVRAEAVATARVDTAAMERHGLPDLCVFHWDASERTATARLFAPGYAIEEDAACASVGLALGVWLADLGLPEAETAYGFRIVQGAELGRPAVLECTVAPAADPLTVTVAGAAPRELAGSLADPAGEAAGAQAVAGARARRTSSAA
ncbi:PhzF family phenazine biosynthesis isomerase [Streptomyces sp. NPDC047097]|uniref:PhzF family phenazine biosynthesis protein n=1 Tax=Streptomyces sp. NPDC047097 TaxID=3155260 RepID=UPI0033FA35D5